MIIMRHTYDMEHWFLERVTNEGTPLINICDTREITYMSNDSYSIRPDANKSHQDGRNIQFKGLKRIEPHVQWIGDGVEVTLFLNKIISSMYLFCLLI